MTRPGRASALLAVLAGDYAILMLNQWSANRFRRLCGFLCSCLTRAALFEYVFDAPYAPLRLTSPSNIKATRYTPTRP